jgi:hypothetical protein
MAVILSESVHRPHLRNWLDFDQIWYTWASSEMREASFVSWQCHVTATLYETGRRLFFFLMKQLGVKT